MNSSRSLYLIRSGEFARALWFVALLAVSTLTIAADSSSELSYTVSLAHRAEHLVHVRLVLPPGLSERDLQLPAWNALYQIRDFSQYVGEVSAKDRSGRPLRLRKVDKSGWHIAGAALGAVVEYDIFTDTPGPFGAQLNLHHAFFNLAQVLLYPVDGRNAPVAIQFVDIPPNWRIATSLKSSDGSFHADNYDRLVDAPIEMSAFQESDFDEGGGHYRVVVDADPETYEMNTRVETVRRIVKAATTWMNDRPFDEYVFLYHFPQETGGGGMEHAFSTAIDMNAGVLRTDSFAFAGVTAHEFFHLWNVKRIRPQSLEPIDYTRENYTRALWFSEGVTSTAGGYILLRAGLADESGYLRYLASRIRELESRPADRTQSVEDSSLDAWLEKYSYYRLPARSISYYNKGEIVGVMLDLQLRESSEGRASLRDLFQWMNQHYAKQGRFFPDSEGVRQAGEAVCHCDVSQFFANYVSDTVEIPYDHFFNTVGLRLKKQKLALAELGFTAVRNFTNPPRIATVGAGSAAEKAGLQQDDTLLQINGINAADDFEDRLGAIRPDETLRLRVRTETGIEHELHWKVGRREEVEFVLVDVDNITPQQRDRRAAWLRGESQGEGHP